MLKESTVGVNNMCEDIEWDAPVWSNGSVEVAPEEADTPDPCSFTSVLAYMEVPYEEAKEEYFKLLPDHIGPALKDSAEILKILTSELALDRFVPGSWTGITGFPPLEIKVRSDFPDSMKARARPINPKLYENAHKEFIRLKQYLYRDSVSPWASFGKLRCL
jgi:hypothetical protein